MYMKGHRADGKTVWLKPYYYVLNNILRQSLYSKGGDATYIQDDSPVVLDCFGEAFTSFFVSHYIWNRIFHASEDVVKHFPYAPYIMHIIEQVLGIKFPIDAHHAMLMISNKTSLKAKEALKDAAKAARASGSTSRASPLVASRSRHAHSEEPQPFSSSGKKPSKFKFCMTDMFGACCAGA